MQTVPAAVVAISLLAFLPACAASYRDRCQQQGYQTGSPEFSDCVQSGFEQARRDRKRHLTYGKGG